MALGTCFSDKPIVERCVDLLESLLRCFSGIVWPQAADFAVTWALKSFDIGERLILWCIISKRFEMVRYHCLFLVLMFQMQFGAIKGAINQSSPSAEIARFHVLNFIDAPSKKALSGHCRVELCANCCLLLVGFLCTWDWASTCINLYIQLIWWGEDPYFGVNQALRAQMECEGRGARFYGCLWASCSSLPEMAMAMGKSQLSMGNDIVWETQCHKII